MADYSSYAETATTMLQAYGTSGGYNAIRNNSNSEKPWEQSTAQTTRHETTYVSFPDDGITFKDVNVTGETRILLVKPIVGIQPAVGDSFTNKKGNDFSVKSAKVINPDDSERDILWILLVQ